MNQIFYKLNLVRRNIETSHSFGARLINTVMQILHWYWLSVKYKEWIPGQWLNCMYAYIILAIRKQMRAREYFSYNLHTKPNRKEQLAIHSHNDFMTVFETLNVFGYGSEHSPLIGDKLAMNRFFLENDIPTPKTYGRLSLFGESRESSDSEPVVFSLKDLETIIVNTRDIQDNGFVLKPRFGTGGYGVFVFNGYNLQHRSLTIPNGDSVKMDVLVEQIRSTELQKTLSVEMNEPDSFIIQQRINQHPQTAKWHPQSSNTFRIFSINGNRGTEILLSTLKMGAGSNTIDNLSQGGVLVQVESDTGKLWAEGRWPQGVGMEIVDGHPDTGLKFAGEVMPMWAEVLMIIKKGHTLLSSLPTIAWDIAMAVEGPMVVEINSITQFARWQVLPGFSFHPEDFRDRLE